MKLRGVLEVAFAGVTGGEAMIKSFQTGSRVIANVKYLTTVKYRCKLITKYYYY